MRVVRKDLVGNRIDHLVLIVLEEVQLDQIGGLEGLSVDGVGAVFGEPWEDVVGVEDCAFGGTDGGFEGLEGEGAKVEGETFEGVVRGV